MNLSANEIEIEEGANNLGATLPNTMHSSADLVPKKRKLGALDNIVEEEEAKGALTLKREK